MRKIIYYLPRILAILITSFFAVFILEGFGPGFGWQDSLAHAIVAVVAFGAMLLAWKKPGIGGWFYIGAGAYLFYELIEENWLAGLLIPAIFLIAGVLFIIEFFRNKFIRP